jgi:tetratricopeptide (TPR) repeat protein
MTVSTMARAAIWTICGAVVLPASLSAQEPAGHSLSLSRDERTALQALELAARGTDRAAQDAALAAARAAAQSEDARHAFAHYQLEIALGRQDAQLSATAVNALVSTGAPGHEMPSLLASQARTAFFQGEVPQAERLLARAVQLEPDNTQLVADHAQLKAAIGMALLRGGRRPEAQTQFQEAVELLQRAIQLQQAAGQAVPESWYQRATALASDYSIPQRVTLARALVTAYPTHINWRDALHVYRQAVQPDPALDLDIRRLLRAAGGLSGERDYLEFAQALNRAELAGEEKAVLEEGVARGMLSASEAVVRQMTTANTRRATTARSGLARARTQALAAATGAAARAAGDSHFGFGEYATAAELYRAALEKGGEDPNLVNTRLGAALAMAGQRAEAEAALRAVTGPRADLAAFWLAWLARRPA